MTVKRSGARLWLLAFLGFFLLHAGWTLATPYNGPTDEKEHVIRAYGVAHGQFIAESGHNGGYLNAPDSLDRKVCYQLKLSITPTCDREPGGDETVRLTHTTAARFNPVYYLVTGWPIGIWPNWLGIILARLLSGMAMAALLACAVVAANRWIRSRALVAGLVVGITPMTAHLGGAVNPNGVEIAAGAALFAALLTLLHEQREGINRAAVVLAGISASVLVTPRFTGLLWLVVIFGAMLIPSSRARLAELARSRLVRVWAAVIVLCTLASGLWTVLVRPADPLAMAEDHGYSTTEILRTGIVDHIWPNLANQMVGVTGWTDLLMPRLVYVAWFMALGVLLIGGVAVGDKGEKWRMILLFAATFVPLIGMELISANQIGWINQGRYFLPGAVGLPMLGAYILSRRSLRPEHLRSATRIFAVMLLPIHFVCLAYSMTRWDSGLVSLNPFNGSWHPPLGVALPLVTGAVGVAVLFVMYWRASRIPVEPSDPEPKEGDQVTIAAPAEPVGANV